MEEKRVGSSDSDIEDSSKSPSDQHWLFYERVLRDIKINGRVIK